jgi:regulator of sirC expression with transglutaminase-like and TPR domain
MKKTPLSLVQEQFQSKEKLVSALEKLATDDLFLDRLNEKKGLVRVSNKKLLRLHAALSAVKERFGSRDKLITAIAELEQRQKDQGYRARLESYPTPRLLDLLQAAERRAGRATSAPAKTAPAKAKKPVAKKPVAKKAAAKKAPAKRA